MKVCIVFGTRPEIIKLAPVIHELKKSRIDFILVHTGQHYSENMDAIFWRYFNLPEINFQLQVRQATHAKQTAEMLRALDDVFAEQKPDWVVVHGDTNSTLSGALTASKHKNMRIAHVEAGLRSFDRRMPEEINRVIVDHISDLLFAPTEEAKQLLLQEGISSDKILVTGNTIEDILMQNISRAESQSQILEKLQIINKKYVLMTVHRQENTDDQTRLEQILNACFTAAEKQKLHVVFPMHPRTKDRLIKNNFSIPKHVTITEPLGYDDFLVLEKNAVVLATDSGGLQEEACILKVPCITLRENTERPETVKIGANLLVGTQSQNIIQAFEISLKSSRNWQSPYGAGQASARIREGLVSHFKTRKTA